MSHTTPITQNDVTSPLILDNIIIPTLTQLYALSQVAKRLTMAPIGATKRQLLSDSDSTSGSDDSDSVDSSSSDFSEHEDFTNHQNVEIDTSTHASDDKMSAGDDDKMGTSDTDSEDDDSGSHNHMVLEVIDDNPQETPQITQNSSQTTSELVFNSALATSDDMRHVHAAIQRGFAFQNQINQNIAKIHKALQTLLALCFPALPGMIPRPNDLAHAVHTLFDPTDPETPGVCTFRIDTSHSVLCYEAIPASGADMSENSDQCVYVERALRVGQIPEQIAAKSEKHGKIAKNVEKSTTTEIIEKPTEMELIESTDGKILTKDQRLLQQLSKETTMVVMLEFHNAKNFLHTIPSQNFSMLYTSACTLITLHAVSEMHMEPFFAPHITCIAPNLTTLITAQFATKFVLLSNGLGNLAVTTSQHLLSYGAANTATSGGNILASKQSETLLHQLPIVTSLLTDKKKKKAVNLFAGKIVLTARADNQGLNRDGSYGAQLLKQIEKKLNIFQKGDPYKRLKALPAPNKSHVKMKSRRGGRVARLKKAYRQESELQNRANMVKFGSEAQLTDEITGVQYGILAQTALTNDSGGRKLKWDRKTQKKMDKLKKLNDVHSNAFPLLMGLKKTALWSDDRFDDDIDSTTGLITHLTKKAFNPTNIPDLSKNERIEDFSIKKVEKSHENIVSMIYGAKYPKKSITPQNPDQSEENLPKSQQITERLSILHQHILPNTPYKPGQAMNDVFHNGSKANVSHFEFLPRFHYPSPNESGISQRR